MVKLLKEYSLDDTDAALDKLHHIQQLWQEIGRTKTDTPEYETLLKKIRVLSEEYQAIVDASEERKKPK